MAAIKNAGAIAKKAQASGVAKKGPSNIKEWISSYQSQFAKALPTAITPERFTRMALSAVSQNETLAACTVESFLGALMQAAQLGLEPNTPLGQAYIVPYYNNKSSSMEAQFELGYKGLIDLAYRSGEVKMIQAHVVRENDFYEFEYGLDPKLVHRPAASNRGNATHVYAVFKLVNGGEGFQVMSMADIYQHALKYSKNKNKSTGEKILSNVWQNNFEAMAKKTVLKALLKYAPLKSEFVRGMVSDETTQIIQMPTNPDEDMNIIVKDSFVVDQEAEVTDPVYADAAAAPAPEMPPVPWPDEAPPAAS